MTRWLRGARLLAAITAMGLGVGVGAAGCGGASAESRCCVNGRYYACPINAGPTCEGCTADPSKDASCKP